MHRYLVMAMRRPRPDPAVVPRHQACLDEWRAPGKLKLSDPFGDQSGNADLLRAGDLAEATAIAHDAPAHFNGGWRLSVYEWRAK